MIQNFGNAEKGGGNGTNINIPYTEGTANISAFISTVGVLQILNTGVSMQNLNLFVDYTKTTD